MDVLDEVLGTRLLVRGSRGLFGGGRIDGGFVVKAVEVTASILELLDPFLGLLAFVSMIFLDECRKMGSDWTDLSDHHVAVEGTLAKGLGGSVDVRTDHCDNGSAKGHVGYKVTVHNVDVKPVCAMADGVRAGLAQGAKVGREDGRGDDCWRGHCVCVELNVKQLPE